MSSSCAQKALSADTERNAYSNGRIVHPYLTSSMIYHYLIIASNLDLVTLTQPLLITLLDVKDHNDTDPLPPTTYGAQGNKDHNKGHPLALPSGPITRSRAKKYGATMSLYIQEQITQELHDLAFNKCYEELGGTPKFLTLLEAQVEWETCLASTPVQGDTPQAVQATASQGTTYDSEHARAG
ncbi:hypothetical protein JCGZ_03528 [Jatropha curcas]|uniref:Uncharacterized protein n=1 Tax=Jatropha curcas TaxID=180498 RepID=A0A067JGG4_JATCU|nr:hypothetical protein JCGZ_03528 [Jatropha curcas]